MHEDNPPVSNVCFSPNGRFVLASSLDNCIRLWDFVAGSVKKTYQGHKNEKYALGGCFAICGSRPLVASASEDGRLMLWDVMGKSVAQAVDAHIGVCFWVDVNDRLMVSGGHDRTVRMFTNENATPLEPPAADDIDSNTRPAPDEVHPEMLVKQEHVEMAPIPP